MKWVIYFFIFILVFENVMAFSIGVSPKEIRFDSGRRENQIVLLNANEFDVEYNISLENDGVFEFEKDGRIGSNDIRRLVVRYNRSSMEHIDDRLNVRFSSFDEEEGIRISPTATIKVVVEQDEDWLGLLDKREELLDSVKKNWVKVILTGIAIAICLGVFIWLMVS